MLVASSLRPPCSAGERLARWTPVDARNALDGAGYPTNLVEEDLCRISGVLQLWSALFVSNM
jgi:hypothetical protein